MSFSVLIKYFILILLSFALGIGLIFPGGYQYRNEPKTYASVSQEGLSPGQYCDKYQYASIRHEQLKTKINTFVTKIVNAFDIKYNPEQKINKYATVIGKLNSKMSNTNSKMVMYIGNCAKHLILQQILKNRSMLNQNDNNELNAITQIFLDEYNGTNTEATHNITNTRTTLNNLSNGTGTTSNTTQTSNPGSIFGGMYLDSSSISLGGN